MAGLMDLFDDPQMQLGLGLLAAAAPRADGAGFGQRLMEGVGTLSAFKKQKLQEQEAATRQKMLDMQMQEAQRQADTMAKQRAWREGLPSILSQSVYGSSDVGPTKAPDTKAIESYLMQADSPYADKVFEQKYLSKPEAYTLGEGQVRYQGNQVIARGPEKTTDEPSLVREYEYAKKNGYKGSFEQFKAINPTIMAGAIAPLRAAQEENLKGRTAYELPKPPTPTFSVTVNGQTFAFPDQKSLNNFKMKAGIK